MYVLRETPDVTTKLSWYDLTNILVQVSESPLSVLYMCVASGASHHTNHEASQVLLIRWPCTMA